MRVKDKVDEKLHGTNWEFHGISRFLLAFMPRAPGPSTKRKDEVVQTHNLQYEPRNEVSKKYVLPAEAWETKFLFLPKLIFILNRYP